MVGPAARRGENRVPLCPASMHLHRAQPSRPVNSLGAPCGIRTRKRLASRQFRKLMPYPVRGKGACWCGLPTTPVHNSTGLRHHEQVCKMLGRCTPASPVHRCNSVRELRRVTSDSSPVGRTGFEPVTSSVSGRALTI